MASVTDMSAASSTITTTTTTATTASAVSNTNNNNQKILEITIISAQDIPPVLKSQRTYALIWVAPNKKRSTRIDPKGQTNPTWNHKFSFRIDDEFLRNDASAVTVEIYAVAWFRDVLVGTVRINLHNLLSPPQQQSSEKNERFMALQIRRPSGDPQGMLNMGVALFDSSRGGPVHSEVSATSSDCRDLLEKKMSKFLTADEISDSSKPGSAVNGSSTVCGGSEVCSDIGPSASVVAAEMAAAKAAETRGRKTEADGGGSVILGELTAEEAAAKGITAENQAVAGVKNKGRLFSCYGFEVTIVCGSSSKKLKND